MQDNMKVILFTTLLLFSINGFAFNWKFVLDNGNGYSFYVDVDNIKKHNGIVYYWELVDNHEPLVTTVVTNSLVYKNKVDCVEEKVTIITQTNYNKSMGKGSVTLDLKPDLVDYPKPNSGRYEVMKFACNNAK